MKTTKRVWPALFFAACTTSRSSLHPAGPAARKLSELGWPLLLGFSLVTIVVWCLLIWVVTRRTGRFEEHAPLGVGGGASWIGIGGFFLPSIAFGIVFVATLRSMNSFPTHEHHSMAPDIRVIGHQWWWEVQYPGEHVSEQVGTANDIHIPIDRPVQIELVAADVIHSFWVPRLHGKVDLVPGMVNQIRIEAEQPGTYEGACAEYCGLQHAKMRFVVVAQPLAEYQAWLQKLRADADAPATPEARRGQELFMNGPCMSCHTIRGTAAHGTVGPELTHFAQRTTVGAGALPKDLATLHAWVANAPSIKPGTRMPAMTRFRGDELSDLVAYLESLH